MAYIYKFRNRIVAQLLWDSLYIYEYTNETKDYILESLPENAHIRCIYITDHGGIPYTDYTAIYQLLRKASEIIVDINIDSQYLDLYECFMRHVKSIERIDVHTSKKYVDVCICIENSRKLTLRFYTYDNSSNINNLMERIRKWLLACNIVIDYFPEWEYDKVYKNVGQVSQLLTKKAI